LVRIFIKQAIISKKFQWEIGLHITLHAVKHMRLLWLWSASLQMWTSQELYPEKMGVVLYLCLVYWKIKIWYKLCFFMWPNWSKLNIKENMLLHLCVFLIIDGHICRILWFNPVVNISLDVVFKQRTSNMLLETVDLPDI
jgi:hypothetical protein